MLKQALKKKGTMPLQSTFELRDQDMLSTLKQSHASMGRLFSELA